MPVDCYLTVHNMRVKHFTRPSIAAATTMLEVSLSQEKFDQMIFRVALEDSIPFDTSVSLAKKAALLGREVIRGQDRIVSTADGHVTLAEAVVREAIAVTMSPPARPEEQDRLIRALALDGFVIQWSEAADGRVTPMLRAALPEELDLPAADDEVHQLLTFFAFEETRGHLDQAIEAHTRGDWAAANSQTRTFMESLFDAIAVHIDPALSTATSENRRASLAQRGFLSVPRNEWTPEGKNFINGLFKMLHTEGSHPGLSDEDRSTFRLHVALVTGRTFLRRFKNGG